MAHGSLDSMMAACSGGAQELGPFIELDRQYEKFQRR